MVGTKIQESTNVSVASAKCAARTEPVTCLIVANGSTMAPRLSIAARITTTRMMGADASSSIYLEQICAAVRRVIHRKINARNNKTPPFQHTSTRLKIDHCSGRKKNIAAPAITEIHSRGCSRKSSFIGCPVLAVPQPASTAISRLLALLCHQILDQFDQLIVAPSRLKDQSILAVDDDRRRPIDAICHDQVLRGTDLQVDREGS